MKTNYSIPLFIVVLLFGFVAAQAQERTTIKGYNEFSASLGLGGVAAGIAGPYPTLLYTRGLQFGEYFDAGLCVGYEVGASAQLTLRAKIPFGDQSRCGFYLSGNGGASFFSLEGTTPVLSGSTGLYWRFKRGSRLYAGPFYTKFYTYAHTEPKPEYRVKDWGGALGLRVGFQF